MMINWVKSLNLNFVNNKIVIEFIRQIGPVKIPPREVLGDVRMD
jgi:hypothetical protein